MIFEKMSKFGSSPEKEGPQSPMAEALEKALEEKGKSAEELKAELKPMSERMPAKEEKEGKEKEERKKKPPKTEKPEPKKPEELIREKVPPKIEELIKQDKELRAEFFKLREKLTDKKISREEKNKIKEKLKEINAKCEPLIKELDAKSQGLYSEIMEMAVRRKKEMSEKEWEDIVKKSGGTLKEVEEKLRKIEEADPNIKKYLEERIKQKKEQLGIIEAISPRPTQEEKIKEVREKLKESKPEELKPKKKLSLEEKIIEKAKEGKPLSKKEREIWQRIKEKKIEKELETETRQIRKKKQREEVLSEKEARRLEMVKLKRDIIQRSEEAKEIEKRKLEELKIKTELLEKLDPEVEKQLKEFNIQKKDLETIKNFETLSRAQQLFVIENLRQLTLGRTQEEAAARYREDTAKSKFLGRVWKVAAKKYEIAKLEKATVKQFYQGGVKIQEKALQQLVRGMKETGLEVEEKEGKLEIQYASGFENLTPEEKKIVENFNKLATEYSRMPYEWRLKTADKKQRKGFEKTYQEYQGASKELLNLREKKNDGDKQEASLYINDIEKRILLNQFLTSHPEVEEQLQKIKDRKTWLRAFSNVITERGIYATAGFLTRSLTVSLFGAIGIPLAAAGMGGWLARGRAKEFLIEEEKMARGGVERKRMDISKDEKKNIVDVQKTNRRLERLVNKIEVTENEERKEELLGRLKVLIEANEARIDRGWINFGTEEERLKNQLDFIQTLSMAKTYLEGNKKEVEVSLKTSLEKILNLREEKISQAQKKYINKQMMIGAGIGAGFAVAGWALRHFVPDTWFDWRKKTITEVPPPPEAPVGVVPPEAPPPKPGVVVPEDIKPEVLVPVEVVPEIKPEILTIGERGPEGAIIDYFRENPDIAVEKFGCPEGLVKDGVIQDVDKFNEWVGRKAHLLWLEDANEALDKPETIEQLKKLGYSPDEEGYRQMMHRIGKGFVELDPQTGKINLVDMEYLRTRVVPEVPVTPEPSVQAEVPVTPEMPTPPEIPTPPETWGVTEMPPAEPTEQIFAGISPEAGRTIITEKLHEQFGMWSGTYDKFSYLRLNNFLELDISSGDRISGEPWENYDYHEFSNFQKSLEKVYNSLDPSERAVAANLTVEGFIKKYYLRVFEK